MFYPIGIVRVRQVPLPVDEIANVASIDSARAIILTVHAKPKPGFCPALNPASVILNVDQTPSIL